MALALLLFTGARKSDAIRLGPQHIRHGRIAFVQKKTGGGVDMSLSAELARIIAARPSRHLTFLVTRDGKPFTVNGFGNAFRAWCNEANLPRCSSHGLRKTMARRLAESGAKVSEIMSVTGHIDPRMAIYYAREAERKALADSAMARIEKRAELATESEQRFPNLSPRFGNQGK